MLDFGFDEGITKYSWDASGEYLEEILEADLQDIADALMRAASAGRKGDEEYRQEVIDWLIEVWSPLLKSKHLEALDALTPNRRGMESFILSAREKDKRTLREIHRLTKRLWPLSYCYPDQWDLGGTFNLARRWKLGFAPPKFYTPPRRYSGAYTTYTFPWSEINGDQFLLSIRRPWLPIDMRPDLVEADDYAAECRQLQASKAGRKAKRLLLANLTDQQCEDYYRRGYFFVAGKREEVELAGHREVKRRFYLIERSYPNGNVMELVCWKPRASYCYHPKEPYPLDDILLTQKLMLETDEEAFLKEANRTSRQPTTIEEALRAA